MATANGNSLKPDADAARLYPEWVASGRRHQLSGRPVDAMLCFRRAARPGTSAPDAHFHLGEVLWQLGRPSDALVAWREAMRLDPRLAAPAQAAAEALLALGDVEAARQAAEHVLTLISGDNRAHLIAAVARMKLTPDDAGAMATLTMDVLARDPSLLAVPTLAQPLADALDRLPDTPAKLALLDRIAFGAASALPNAPLPALLLALVCERVINAGSDYSELRATLFGHARIRTFAAAEHEALRRIARAAVRSAQDDALALVQSYAQLCAAAFVPGTPLGWPRRTAGTALRVVALVAAMSSTEEALAALASLAQLPRERFAIVIAAIGGATLSESLAGNLAATRLPTIVLSEVPESDDAKRLAALDPDMLIDLAGLSAASGPLLGRRPARLIVTPSDLAAANVAPLIDRADARLRGLGDWLDKLQRALPASDEVPDIAAMATLWEDAVRAHQQGNLIAARECYTRVLAIQPGYAPAHYLLGIVLREGGDAEGAHAQFVAAITSAPHFVDARIAAAKAAQAAGDIAGALVIFAEGFAHASGELPLIRAYGLTLLAAHDGEHAADTFAAVLARDPTDGETHYNHGVALQMQRKADDAARAYQRALAFQPDLVAADFNLGTLFQEEGAVEPAIAAYETVLKSDPANVAAYKNLGEVLFAAGRVDAWLANFRQFESHCSGALPLAVQALVVCQYTADFSKLERILEGLRRERYAARDGVELCDCLEEILYLLLYFDVEPELLHRFAKTYDVTAQRIHGQALPPRASRKPGRLRIGYLSPDLRNHVMGKMLWQAVEHHDRSRFELFFYALSAQEDEWTARFRGLADHYVNITHLPERAGAERIAADDLDVLVDAAGHTHGARPGILALKPARIQVTHVGSAGAVGLSAIDFKLTDGYADVPENQAYQIEKLLAMDGCVYPYRHIARATDPPFQRGSLGIPRDAVVIGAFVSALKLSRRCLGLWREVLARVPRAKLAFSPAVPAHRPFLVGLAAAAGISADRIVFIPQGRDDAENQARYEVVDWVLDPMPYGGANGTLEALDMGIPVVTFVGKRHSERTSYSILTNLGVSATIARTGREYVDIAVRLAEDPAFAVDVRTAIRTGLAHSPLTDRMLHTRNLERAYLRALEQKCPGVLAADDHG